MEIISKEDRLKKLRRCMISAKRHFHYYYDHMIVAEALIEAGFAEALLNNPFIRNAISLLAPFVSNRKIKEALKLLEEGIKEEGEKHAKKTGWV